MDASKVMLGLVWVNRNGFHGRQGGINEVEVKEVPGIETAEATDETTNAEITEEEEAGNLPTTLGAERI